MVLTEVKLDVEAGEPYVSPVGYTLTGEILVNRYEGPYATTTSKVGELIAEKQYDVFEVGDNTPYGKIKGFFLHRHTQQVEILLEPRQNTNFISWLRLDGECATELREIKLLTGELS